MDAVTGLSGTGPMYVFHFVEAMADAGVKVGLSRDVASRLAIQTLIGSAHLARDSHLHAAALKDQVTSPGGTAIAALHVLRREGFQAIVMDAVEAATRRAQELGQ
jgi:pyrroline-5-carboxylate reductase